MTINTEHEHTPEQLSRVPIVDLNFQNPGLADTDQSKQVSLMMGELNQMALKSWQGSILENPIDKRAVLGELVQHYKRNAYFKLMHERKYNDGDADPAPELPTPAVVDLKENQKQIFTVPLSNEVDVDVLYYKLRFAIHDLDAIFTMLVHIDNPIFAKLFQGKEGEYLQRMKDELKDDYQFYQDKFEKEPITVATVLARFQAFMEPKLREGNIEPPASPTDKIKENRTLVENTKVIFSDPWLMSLANNLAQNIVRATNANPTTQVTVDYHLPQDREVAVFTVSNTNSQFPQRFIDRGFIPGEGENEGGEHLAMARLQTTIQEQYKGSVRVYNRDGRAVVEVSLPLEQNAAM